MNCIICAIRRKYMYDEVKQKLLQILKCGPHSTKTTATLTTRYCKTWSQTGVVQKLQSKTILPTMLSSCPNGSLARVFGRFHKAFFQGTPMCMKELKGHAHSSQTSLLRGGNYKQNVPSLPLLAGGNANSCHSIPAYTTILCCPGNSNQLP